MADDEPTGGVGAMMAAYSTGAEVAALIAENARLLACREAAVGLAEAVEPLLPEVNHTGTGERCPHCERWEPVRGALAAFREASG